MKKRLAAIVALLVVGLLAGCLEPKPRNFFAADGIRLGAPLRQIDHFYLPIDFKTAVENSGQWLYDVKCTIEDNTITVTAIFTVPPNLQESRYHGAIDLLGSKRGVYQVRYRDPDGTLHDIGTTTLE